MKKFLLLVFILVDLAVIGASAAFLVSHIKGTPFPIRVPGMTMPLTATATPATPRSATVTASTTTVTPGMAPPAPTPAMASASTPTGAPGSHKIGFTYRNSKAKKVMIRAEFTGWRAEAMEKDAATGTWKYTAVLDPGEYAYCYSVDDKSIRDPANKHTKLVGKTVVSLLTVPFTKPAAH